MRAVVQRVKRASVSVNNEGVGAIGPGLVVLLGIKNADSQAEAKWLAHKVANLRIFADEQGKMNLSALDVGGAALVQLYRRCPTGGSQTSGRLFCPMPARGGVTHRDWGVSSHHASGDPQRRAGDHRVGEIAPNRYSLARGQVPMPLSALLLLVLSALLHAAYYGFYKRSADKQVFAWWFLLVAVVVYAPALILNRPVIPAQGWLCLLLSGLMDTAGPLGSWPRPWSSAACC
jgi:hypothetical protein